MKKLFAILLMVCLQTNVYANETVSYDEALRLVLNNNSSLTNLEDSVKLLEETRSEVSKTQNQLYANFNGQIDQSRGLLTQVIGNARNIMSFDYQLSNVPLNRSVLQNTSELMLRNYLTNIETTKTDIATLADGIKLSESKLSVLKLKQDMGLASSFEVSNLQTSLEQDKLRLENAKAMLQSNQNALYKLMGKQSDVEFKPKTLQPITLDIDAYVTQQLNDSPIIQMKQKAVDEAKYNVESYAPLMTELEVESKNKLGQAQRDLLDKKNALELSIRTAYNNLKSLEANRTVLQANLKNAQDLATQMKIKFDTGYITANDLNQANLSVLNAQNAILKNDCDYDLLSFKLSHSYLL